MMNQISFAKLETGMDMPHLLDIQTRAFESLLQLDAASQEREDVGLERVFKDLFPITDVHENFSLDFIRYSLGEPKYTVAECIERDMTYSAPLKATLQLVIFEDTGDGKRPRNIIEKEVYLGELPLLTELGTFVINGAERVIVSQLHRSPGVVFEESTHPNGQRLLSSRIIPFRGSWVEFTVDIHDVIYVHIDKKKKFPATALLRAFGYGENRDILRLFFAERELDLTKKRETRNDQPTHAVPQHKRHFMPFGDGRIDDFCEIGEVVVLRIQRHARAAALAVAAQVETQYAIAVSQMTRSFVPQRQIRAERMDQYHPWPFMAIDPRLQLDIAGA